MVKRRDFIKKGLAGTAGLAIGGMGFSSRSYASIIGSNDRLNVAVVGIRGRGRTHIRNFCNLKDIRNVRVLTLCDVDEQFFPENVNNVQNLTGIEPKKETDMRRIFEDRDIHAVSFAATNHWHALGTIWACQAGKHVFVEKPGMHNIFEGRKMIDAARKYDVRVQMCYQTRSVQNVQKAIKFIHEGGIGDVYMARGLCIKPRNSFGIAYDSNPPDSLHYDMWLGPAAYQPYNEKKVHYNWHWHWNTGNGDIGNQGPHQFDIARWGLNKHVHPVKVYSSGGIYGWGPDECSQETPNTQTATFNYPDGKILEFEVRGRSSNSEGRMNLRVGNIFYGTEGWLELTGSRWNAFRDNEDKPFAGSDDLEESEPEDPTFMRAISGSEHWVNFIDAIRSGKNSDLVCDIREGFYSSALPLLANISYRLNRSLSFMGEFEKFADDPEANIMLSRIYRKPYVVPSSV